MIGISFPRGGSVDKGEKAHHQNYSWDEERRGKGPERPSYVTGYFNRLVKKAGVRSIKFRALRHTHATLLGAAGVPLKSVSARLGHSSVVMTGDIYPHVFSDMDREAADTFEEILNKAKAGKEDYLSMAE